MDNTTADWLEAVSLALADARAALACFGVTAPLLEARIEAALAEAHALKLRARRP